MYNKKSILGAMLTGIMSFMLSQMGYATNVDKIVAFGDSLSDNGNIYSLTKKAHRVISMVPIIPKNPPYYDGRFSNGPVWLEDLAVAMDVPLSDYAYGGSWAEPLRDSGLVFPFSLGMQVDMYMTASVLDFNQQDHLFVIWTGSNDYIEQRDDIDYASDNTIATIKKNVEWLISYGAKHFLIPDMPDISVAPEIVKRGPEAVKMARAVTDLHNQKLQAMLDEEKLTYPEVDFVTVDVTSYMDDMIANPDKYNLKNFTSACYGGGYWLDGMKLDENEVNAAKQTNVDFSKSLALRTTYLTAKLEHVSICQNPDQFMFWDQLHPTRSMHMILAKEALTILHEAGIFGASSEVIARK